MAHSLKLEGFFQADGAVPDFRIEPFWWEFGKEDPRFKAVDWYGVYLDHVADLTVQETIELHEKYRGIWRADRFYDRGGWKDLIEARIAALDSELYGRPEAYDHFVATWFEWESGM